MNARLVGLVLLVLFISGCSGERVITKTVTEEVVVMWAEYSASYSNTVVSPQIWGIGFAGYGNEGLGMSAGGLVFTRKHFSEQYVSIFLSTGHGELVSQCADIYEAVKTRKMGDIIVLQLKERYLVSCVDDQCDEGTYKKMKLLNVSVVSVL